MVRVREEAISGPSDAAATIAEGAVSTERNAETDRRPAAADPFRPGLGRHKGSDSPSLRTGRMGTGDDARPSTASAPRETGSPEKRRLASSTMIAG